MHHATIIEVFTMRLGTEVLVDVTLEPEDADRFPEPKPNDLLVFELDGETVEHRIWAAPRVSQPKGSGRVNVQFQKQDVGERLPEEGARVELRPPQDG